MLEELGGYRLQRLLGEGAAGRVYLAEQREPRRLVAIKILRRAAGATRKRFEREVELLAQLEHTNIARLYDSGVAADATGELPYMVMEYVDGPDLLHYANARQLDLRGRLTLLAQVARAAHFAHTRGVIHRDLKPGNILVSERGEPKILDFGVARVMHKDATQVTHAGEILGTLAYMSWEQLYGEGDAVDARSDVYALGVIGYQLLCGELPYPGLSGDTLISAIRRLQRETPVSLSRRQPQTRGDVETLIMKALARDVSQRYPSAAEFAADIERFLTRRPIEARPPTMRYLLGLLVRRHKAVAVASLTVALALVAATVVATRYAIAANDARQEAEARAAEYAAINRFTGNMLSAIQPDAARGREVTVAEVVDKAHAELGQSQQPPRVRASLDLMLGRTYQALGRSEDALPLVSEAVELYTRERGRQASETLQAVTMQVQLLDVLGRADEAEQLLTTFLGPADTESLAISPDNIGLLQMRAVLWVIDGQTAKATPLLDALLARVRQDRDTFSTGMEISLEYWRGYSLDLSGRLPEALASAQWVYEKGRELWGDDSPDTAVYRQSLASRHAWMGDFAAARPLFERSLHDAERSLGEKHPYVASMRSNYARMLLDVGDLGAAQAQARAARSVHTDHGGTQTDEYARATVLLAEALSRDGQHAAAQSLLDELRQLVPILGADNRWMIRTEIEAARGHLATGDFPVAVDAMQTLLTRLDQSHGVMDGLSGEARLVLARGHAAMRQWNPARVAVEQAYPALKRIAGDDHPLIRQTEMLRQQVATANTQATRHAD